MKRSLVLACLSFLLASGVTSAQTFNIDRDGITLSGISSGGFAAQQGLVAFPEIFSGAGIFAAGPFRCSVGRAWKAVTECMRGAPPTQELVAATKQYYQQGLVGDPALLKNKRVFIFAGTKDSVVKQSVVTSVADYFRQFGSTVKVVDVIQAEHTFPTNDPKQQDCLKRGVPYIGYCSYDGAHELLNFLYGGNLKENAKTLTGRLVKFDQSKYTNDPAAISLDTEGFMYVPKACDEGKRCRLHIALHGCQQSAQKVGNAFAAGAGYNAVADANNIVVVYPQTRASLSFPTNPLGCWDWWGYTDDKYDTVQGKQTRFLREIVKGLSGF